MKRTVSILLVLVVVGGCGVPAREQPAPMQATPQQPTPEQVVSEQIDRLLKQLDDDDIDVREEATKRLIELWKFPSLEKDVEQALKTAIRDGQAEVVERSSFVLQRVAFRKMLGTRAVGLLGTSGTDELFQADAEEALKFFEESLTASEKYGLEYPERQGQLGRWVFGKLDESEEKLEFVRTVEKLGLKSCLGPIAYLLRDRLEDLRQRAAEALGNLRACEYASAVAALLKDPKPDVRTAAIETLVQCEAKEFTADIACLLKDPEGWVRMEAAKALGKLGTAACARQLADCLTDESQNVRGAAARALGVIGATEYGKQIAALLKEGNPEVRGDAALSLGQLGAKDFVEDIAVLLQSNNPEERRCAVWALGKLGAVRYAEEISKATTNANADLRGEAAAALGRLGAKEQTRLLVRLLNDEDANVRARALVALGQVDAREYGANIAALLGDTGECCLWEPIDQFGTGTRVAAVAAQVLKSWGLDPEKLKKEREESEKR